MDILLAPSWKDHVLGVGLDGEKIGVLSWCCDQFCVGMAGKKLECEKCRRKDIFEGLVTTWAATANLPISILTADKTAREAYEKILADWVKWWTNLEVEVSIA